MKRYLRTIRTPKLTVQRDGDRHPAAYAESAIANDPNDLRAHGQDQRIGAQAFRDSNEYWYLLIREFASQPE